MQFSEERFLATLQHIGDVLERIADSADSIAKSLERIANPVHEIPAPGTLPKLPQSAFNLEREEEDS
jgi:hypothetical protein